MQREIQIFELYEKMDKDIIDDKGFLKAVASLYIHPNWSEAVNEACDRIESNPEELVELDEVQDLLGAILNNEPSNPRQRGLSKRFFGDDWVN